MATLLTYQSFDSLNTGVLGGQGSWASGGTSGTNFLVSSASLSYSAGSVNISGGSQAVTIRQSGSAFNGARVDLGAINPSGGNIFISALMRYDGTMDTGDSAGFRLTDATSTGPNGVSMQGVAGVYRAQEAINNNTVNSLGSLTIGSTYFVVYELQSSGSAWTNAVTYINPTSTTIPGGAEVFTRNPGIAGYSTAQQYLAIRAANIDTGSGDLAYIDEIRVGTTWGDVVVPEPATVGMLGLGGLVTLLLRRIRS